MGTTGKTDLAAVRRGARDAGGGGGGGGSGGGSGASSSSSAFESRPPQRTRSDTLMECITVHFPDYEQFTGTFVRFRPGMLVSQLLEKVCRKRNLPAEQHEVRIFRTQRMGATSPPSSPPLLPNIVLPLGALVSEINSLNVYVLKKSK
mmetsp:Transcript_26543/g.66793  ORF Transcript_26543/g.66793 Transcript_26543/m.66793 type:complete len:148 (-) Transcript_26543:150-593(-)